MISTDTPHHAKSDANANASVYAAFAASAARWPDHDFLVVLPETAAIYGIDAQTLRYGEALARVDALAARFGESRKALVNYAPDPFIERLFAAYPPLLTPEAEQLGLRHDGTVEQLIARAIAH